MTEQTTLERMADAIDNQMYEDENDSISIARAALMAIREPSAKIYDKVTISGWMDNELRYEDCWKESIDAILAGEG